MGQACLKIPLGQRLGIARQLIRVIRTHRGVSLGCTSLARDCHRVSLNSFIGFELRRITGAHTLKETSECFMKAGSGESRKTTAKPLSGFV